MFNISFYICNHGNNYNDNNIINMNKDEKREVIQLEAKKAWIDAGMIGGLAMTTGSGKSTTALHCATTVPKGGKILFLAETTSRFTDIREDLKKYKKWYKVDIIKDYTWEESTYQSAYKWKDKEFDIVIADEYHFAMSPMYSKFFKNNKYERLVGLSATLKDNVTYEEEDATYSKLDLINKYCPVVYTYNINQSQIDGTSRDKIIFVINHRLDMVEKNILAGSKAKPFKQTEQAAYNYWDSSFKKALFLPEGEKKKWRIIQTSRKRAEILYTAPSKRKVIKKLTQALKSKTIVFGCNLDALLTITPNVVCSRHTDKQNDEIRDRFENGRLRVIGSFKKLEQGANLKGLDNVVMHSYYGKTRPVLQRLGRIRVDPKKKYGFVFILRTVGTQEMKWFDMMTEDLTDFTIVNCDNVDEAINKYKEYVK